MTQSPSCLPDLVSEITGVVSTLRCTGCGLCARLPGISIELQQGFMRPTPSPATDLTSDSLNDEQKYIDIFRDCCPGYSVSAQHYPNSKWDRDFGPVIAAWATHATDPALRHVGSSGGTLTALSTWLLETGQADRIIGAQMDPAAPTRTRTSVVTLPENASSLAGSRYAPVANAASPQAPLTGTIFIGKPCEVQAVRNYAQLHHQEPLLFSFFCAGTPNQSGTTTALEELGVTESDVTALRYRGHGWPGAFTVLTEGHQERQMSYEESWGRALSPTMQWRCRICPDGVGEYSDITAADFWHSTPDGYPDFQDGPGTSALIARTPRGLDVIKHAIKAGIIVAEEISLDSLRAVQPHQRTRRSHLMPRLLAMRVLGLQPLRTSGFHATTRALRTPLASWQQFRGAVYRLRHRYNATWFWRRG